ncbi:MAG TPA: sulfatase-like hydrolase/transferase [Steroidobacteraceae bacterium]|jgi:arylsulfatase A-like enzyme|nr:sulfatase-like hydrolase/transferase [Steroidobacteraceae bacterium]
MPNDLRAWRVAALPAAAVLGIALPLAFVSHCNQFLFDFRAIDLLPLYATAWIVLAAVVVPAWIVLTAALMGLEALHRPAGAVLARATRAVLFGLATVIIVASLIGCLRIWLGTFHDTLPLSAHAAMAIAVLAGALVAVTPRGRFAMRALMPVAAVCTAAGFLSLASLPVFGWHGGGIDVDSARAQAVPTATSLPVGAGTARPNIVLLSIDALSAPHMSLYGYSRQTTPALAQFAQGAVTFDRAYANGNFTTPGIATIVTGTLPWTHRALQLPVWPLTYTRRTSLPAVLERAGYRTGYVSTNAIAGAAKQGVGQYFQFASTDRIGHVTLCADGLSRYLKYVCAASELSPLEEMDDLARRLHGPPHNLEHDPRLALVPALHWLGSVDHSKPIFLWVHLFPPHSPYAVPRPWLGRFDPSQLDTTVASTEPYWAWIQSQLTGAQVQVLEARYDEAVAYADAYAGPFLQSALKILGPNTVIVVTADHGESFDHGYGAHTGPGLYNEIVHIPLIVRLPGETSGSRCDQPVQQADIAPTLAALAGVAAPPDWEGRSLVDACSDAPSGGAAPERAIFSMNFEQNPRFAALKTGSVAVIEGRWKLIHYMGRLHYPFMPPLHDELYDVVSDPSEHHDLAAQQPALVQRLLGLIDTALAQHGGRVVPGSQTTPLPEPPQQSAAVQKPSDMSGGEVAAGSP